MKMYCIGSSICLLLSCLITFRSIQDIFCMYLQFQLIAMDKRLEELDEDVLYWILSYCSLLDYNRMGAVCKSWLSISKWSISSLPPQLPWLMMLSNPGLTSVEEERCFFSLSDSTIYDAIKFPEICGKRCCGLSTMLVLVGG